MFVSEVESNAFSTESLATMLVKMDFSGAYRHPGTG